jgi:tetratricopeptide (TPR) repeat protein
MLLVTPEKSGLRVLRPALLCAGAAVSSLLAAPVAAQTQAQPVAAQPMPSRESLELSAALSQLSREPRNVDALVNAGVAASKLGDFEAAVGFFKRGQALAPSNPRLLAGLAGALVRQGDAASAVPMFARAEAAGASLPAIAADRGLAYDLIGDPQSAQRYYAQALASGVEVEEVTRRLAISQAISGDGSAMEKTLLPLLKKQDKASWRARAFALAIVGQDKEATRIVKTLLPGSLANSITPYLQYMPRLTRAQQAAAANLGIFPRASEIGRDEPRIAALAPAASPRTAGASLVPAGQPLGPNKGAGAVSEREKRRLAKEAEAKARQDARLAEDRRRREARVALASSRQPRVAPPEIKPAREDMPAGDAGFTVSRQTPVPPVAQIMEGRKTAELPPLASAPATAAPPAAPPATVAAAQASFVPPAPSVAPVAAPAPQVAVAQPAPAVAAGFDLARLPVATSAAPPVPAATPPSQPAPAPSFGALFADLGKPSTAAAPAAGAVDLRKIKPKRPQPKPEPEVKKPVPSHPSRIWVQLGIGQKLPALSQDWRKMEKAYPAMLKGRKPFTARLGQTNRLLTGPFASQKEATKFIDALVKAGASRPMVWTSPAGEVVDDLAR